MRTRSLLAGILAASLASVAVAQVAPISGLPAATTPLTGAELFPCYQGSTVAKCTVANVLGGNASTATAWATGQTFSLSGDCTTASPPTVNGTGAVSIPATCTKTNGTAFGTFATANAASPPAIGGTTPAAGSFTTLSASGVISPSSTAGIKGTTAADNVQAGSVGEYQSATVSNPSIGSGGNLATLTLTAGDWDVQGTIVFGANPTSDGLGNCTLGVSTTSATFGSAGTYMQMFITGANLVQTITDVTPQVRVNVSASTTVYLVGTCGGGGGTSPTVTANGLIRARRVR